MNIKPIKTETDYQNALKRVDNLMNAKLGSPQGDELEILAILIEKYEEEKFPILPPDPISAIRFRLEQLGMEQADFAKIVGSNRASEILNGQRAISISLIKKIHKELGIPYECLLKDEPIHRRASSH
jgi:HTH-type transcriptional regulator/antitoxin HigA